MSSEEVRALRQDLDELRFEFEALRLTVDDLVSRVPVHLASGVTAAPSASVAPSSRSIASEAGTVIASSDKEGRAELARHIGRFLRASFEGRHFGSSGRDRLSLRSRLYVALVDYHGVRFPEPRVYREFSSLSLVCKRGPSAGQSVFVGFATEWEARLALEEAEFAWPSQYMEGEYQDGELAFPDDHLLFREGTLHDVKCCHIDVSDADEVSVVNLIFVTAHESKYLVAVPQAAWHRTVARRVLPRGALSRPVNVEVVGDSSDGFGVRVWVGYLAEDLVPSVLPGVSADPGAVSFLDETGAVLLPFGESLMEFANDHFGFLSAVSSPEALAGDPAAQGSVPELGSRLSAFANLDPSVVASALAAGVPSEHLSKLSELFAKKPSQMHDLPRRSPPVGRNVLSESEEEEDPLADAVVQGDGGGGGDSPVEKAVLQLTKLVSSMAKKEKKSSGFESILERGEGGSAESSGSSTQARSKAAAFQRLKAALQERPEWLYTSIEEKLIEDFSLSRSAPGTSTTSATSRGWVEHRSRLGHYPATIRFAWVVAGIHDSLRSNDIAQARARCALALAAIDQSSLDGGSWTLAQEFLLELPPPYNAFANRRQPEPHEQIATRLADDRLVEILLWRLKDRDSFLESRKRLTQASRPKQPPQNPPPKAAPKNKAKAKAKSQPGVEDHGGGES
eukprot:Skav227099  [mRNA]  locus=scaffold199:49523:51667:+ [translate_table: standard]